MLAEIDDEPIEKRSKSALELLDEVDQEFHLPEVLQPKADVLDLETVPSKKDDEGDKNKEGIEKLEDKESKIVEEAKDDSKSIDDTSKETETEKNRDAEDTIDHDEDMVQEHKKSEIDPGDESKPGQDEDIDSSNECKDKLEQIESVKLEAKDDKVPSPMDILDLETITMDSEDENEEKDEFSAKSEQSSDVKNKDGPTEPKPEQAQEDLTKESDEIKDVKDTKTENISCKSESDQAVDDVLMLESLTLDSEEEADDKDTLDHHEIKVHEMKGRAELVMGFSLVNKNYDHF